MCVVQILPPSVAHTSCPACGLELEVKSISVVIVDNVINKVVQVQELTITGEDWGE